MCVPWEAGMLHGNYLLVAFAVAVAAAGSSCQTQMFELERRCKVKENWRKISSYFRKYLLNFSGIPKLTNFWGEISNIVSFSLSSGCSFALLVWLPARSSSQRNANRRREQTKHFSGSLLVLQKCHLLLFHCVANTFQRRLARSRRKL